MKKIYEKVGEIVIKGLAFIALAFILELPFFIWLIR